MRLDLEARLSRLERENRRLRRWLVATTLIAAAPFLVAYVPPNDRVEASEFTVKDKSGTVRARLFVDDDGKTKLVLRDRDGKSPAVLSAGDGAALSVADRQAKTIVTMTASSSKGVILVEEGGKPRAVLSPPPPIGVDVQDPWASPD